MREVQPMFKIMTWVSTIFQSKESMNGSVKMMLSLVPFYLILMVASPLVFASPLHTKSQKRPAREDHLPYDESTNLVNVSLLHWRSKDGSRLTVLHVPDVKGAKSWLHSSPKDIDSFLQNYSDPKLTYKELVYSKRRRRELRTSRKIADSSFSASQSSYYPFLMAEMIPGSVKTRHPSIIAVNGCPAYYIADHKGLCRQVFQYTVNFGQRSPKLHEATSSPSFLFRPAVVSEVIEQSSPPPNTEAPTTIEVTGRPVPIFTPTRPTPSPRLLMLLRSAAKRFDLSFLKNGSSNSGETVNEDGIEKLRRKILSALKITKNKDKDYAKVEAKKPEKMVVVVNTKSTTPDYDD